MFGLDQHDIIPQKGVVCYGRKPNKLNISDKKKIYDFQQKLIKQSMKDITDNDLIQFLKLENYIVSGIVNNDYHQNHQYLFHYYQVIILHFQTYNNISKIQMSFHN